MFIFFIGIIEMLVISIWTKMVSETRIMASGIITVINILIWYYVLQNVVNNIENFFFVAMYAAGCAVGTMSSTAFFRYAESKKKA